MIDIDVITMGRISVDLYPEQVDVPLSEVQSFSKSLGGSPTNVAVAAARLGTRAAVITKVGNDPFGEYLRAALREFGVDSRFVSVDPELRTPLAFCEIRPPDHFPLLYYRQPKAPDMTLSEAELPLADIAQAALFWTTGTGLADEPSRGATLAALEARSGAGQPPGDALTVHDLDYRPMLWSTEEDAGRLTRAAISHATAVVGNTQEVKMAVGTSDPPQAARALIEAGAQLAVVKRGGEGVLALTSDGEEIDVPPVDVDVVNGLGAGDAFGGALCHALVSGWEVERAVRFANAAGAIVSSRRLCADDMPTLGDIEEIVGVDA